MLNSSISLFMPALAVAPTNPRAACLNSQERIEIPIHQAHAHDAGDLDKSSELHSIVFHLLTLKALSERVNPEFDSIVTEKINAWLPKRWIDGILPQARQNFEGLTDEELLKDVANQLLGPPFGDFFPGREIRWSALGVEWHVAWKNDYSTTKEAEQFIAILQIYLAEIARYELCFLRTKVHIWVEVNEDKKIAIEAAPSNIRIVSGASASHEAPSIVRENSGNRTLKYSQP